MYRSGPHVGRILYEERAPPCAPLLRLPPLLSSPDSELGTRNRARRGELGEPRGEEPERVPNQRSKEVGAGGNQSAATMRRASKKSSSSAAAASAGNAPIPGSLPHPFVFVFLDRGSGHELPVGADAFPFARLDAGVIFIRKIQSRCPAVAERARRSDSLIVDSPYGIMDRLIRD